MARLKDNAILGLVLKRFFWVFYDHLGLWVALNFSFFLISLSIVGIPYAFLGLLKMVRRILKRDMLNVSLRVYWQELLRIPLLHAIGFVLSLLVLGICMYGLFFYMHMPALYAGLRMMGSSLLLWTAVFLLTLCPYFWSMLAIEDELSVTGKLKYACYAVFARPLLSLNIIGVILVLSFVLYISVVGLWFLLVSVVAILMMNVFYAIFAQTDEGEFQDIPDIDQKTLGSLLP